MDFGKKRLGNWVITKYNKDGVPHIKVSPVSGEYSWEYSGFDEMFVKIEDAVDSGENLDGFQTCLAIMGGFLHAESPIFYDLYWKCLYEYGKIADERKPSTREEERQIIEDMKLQYELEKEAKEADEGKVMDEIEDK